jgi:hypothetical protein
MLSAISPLISHIPANNLPTIYCAHPECPPKNGKAIKQELKKTEIEE